MNLYSIIGLVLGGGTTIVDRLIHKVPNRLAIVLYAAATALIVIGMIVSR